MESLTFSQVNEGKSSAAVAGTFTAADGIIFVLMFVMICSIIWLANREIRISRIRTRAYEKLLEPERSVLEKKIAERTAAFVHAEEQRMIELQRNAEFGKLSQGLFHDLISPLSSVSLYAQKLEKDANQSYSDETKEMIKTVISSSRRMNSFMESVKRSLGNNAGYIGTTNHTIDTSTDIQADIQKEIDIVLDILGYKARMAGVKISVKIDQEMLKKTHEENPLLLSIHPVRLHQLILNLVSNAIDACIKASIQELDSSEDLTRKPEHMVKISLTKKEIAGNGKIIELSVSDTGCGISTENQEKMFKKQFTTKSDGSGIGLMTIKTIVEQDLKGTIEVESEEGKGARFVIKIPINTNKKYV